MRKYFMKAALGALMGVGAVLGVYLMVCVLSGSSVSDSLFFLWRFSKAPTSVGALAPSSPALARALLAHIPVGQEGQRRHFLEVGAGDGAVTRHLVPLLGVHDELDVVELDDEFAQGLRSEFRDDSRVHVHCCSILDWHPNCTYDAIIMGIPFNALPFSLVKAIWEHVAVLAAEHAPVSYFSYIGLPHVKKTLLSQEERLEFETTQRYLKAMHKRYGKGKTKIWVNAPPARVSYLYFR